MPAAAAVSVGRCRGASGGHRSTVVVPAVVLPPAAAAAAAINERPRRRRHRRETTIDIKRARQITYAARTHARVRARGAHLYRGIIGVRAAAEV